MKTMVRQAEEADWEALRSIRLRALRSDPSVFGSNHRKEEMRTESDWKGLLKTDDVAVFLVYEDASLIGMTGIAVDRNDPTKRTAILWGSWLEPRARGRGLSQVLYEERIAWAKKHRTVEKIIASHRASNHVSKSANQRHAFKYTHSERHEWPDGKHEDNMFYSLDVKVIS